MVILPPTWCLAFLGEDVGLLNEVVQSMLHNISASMHAGTMCNKLVAILVVSNTFREEYEEALHVLNLEDIVEEELDSLQAFATSMEGDDSGDSGVDE